MKQKISNQLLISSAALLLATGLSQGAVVIYEPFDDNNSSLTGNTTGLGLTGNWTAQAAWTVNTGSMSWGALPTSGNSVLATTGGSGGRATATVGASTFGNLLDDGSTVWFSMLYTTTPVVSGNPDAGFALGTAALNGTNNIPMGTGNEGIGFTIKSGNIQASTWVNGTVGRSTTGGVGSEPVTGSTTYFIVGEIIWGADEFTADTINLYLPGTDLALGSVVATRSVILDQSAFDTITYAHKNDSTPASFDEIRFGASYDDVIGIIPEPSAAVLGGLGLLTLLRRRRA